MATIALVGPDGAGKTTVARLLVTSSGLPLRYLYMGVSESSSNVALPTTRLAAWLRRGGRRASSGATNGGGGPRTSPVRAALRHANMLVDEWFRQIVSWWHQALGRVVLYDRYFLFDYSRHMRVDGRDRLSFRLHRFLLEKLYPRPTLVIYLDAPADVLLARKNEGTRESLEARRQAFLAQAAELDNFVIIDATKPLDDVVREVAALVLGLTRSSGTADRCEC